MKLISYSDGGARGNPGPAAIGIVICDHRGRVVEKRAEFLGKSTNNQAEYAALIRSLKIAKKLGAIELECYLDSELVASQAGGYYKTKNPVLKKMLSELKKLESAFRKVEYIAIRRSQGMIPEADRILNKKLDEKEK
jgi:ribonuclease HI